MAEAASHGALIRFSWYEHVEHCYYVLSHLDLGRDAASLFDSTRSKTCWSGDLLRAYRSSPRRLQAHWAPLAGGDHAQMLAYLPDDSLGTALRNALEATQAEVHAAFENDSQARDIAIAGAREHLEADLHKLRHALWKGPPPPLEIIHTPSLGRHGRAGGHQSSRRVAVNLNRPFDEVLIQVFHEECHPISDPTVACYSEVTNRDTRVGSAGYSLHAEIEQAAIDLGRRTIDSTLPKLVPAYRRFCAGFGY